MLKGKEKNLSDIQRRICDLEEENVAMLNQIETLRMRLYELKTEVKPGLIHKRLEQLESDRNKLTSIAIQNRRNHERFSVDVGHQLVETFVTQQTVYGEIHRLQQRLVAVERQNQIMSELIRMHYQNSVVAGTRAWATDSDSSGGAASLQASMEATSISLSRSSFDRDADTTCTCLSNTDWQIRQPPRKSFPPDTASKYAEEKRAYKSYYRIDFFDKSDSLRSLQLTEESEQLSTSPVSTDEVFNTSSVTMDKSTLRDVDTFVGQSIGSLCAAHQKYSLVSHHQRDDGYHSTSQDCTVASDRETDFPRATVAIFHDHKERYLILPRHVQKSRGRSLRYLPCSLSSSLTRSSRILMIRGSLDLETHVLTRRLRQKQRKQRESDPSNTDGEAGLVFSDTELYSTRFCIDSDADDDDDSVTIFETSRLKPLKRSFYYSLQKCPKPESKHISNLEPVIENVSQRERKIELWSSKKSRIVPPRVLPVLSKESSTTRRSTAEIKYPRLRSSHNSPGETSLNKHQTTPPPLPGRSRRRSVSCHST